MTEPAPRAVACDVLDDRIRYEARVSIEHGRYMPQVIDSFTSAVWYAARRAGLPLPLPHAVELQVRDVAVDPMDVQQRMEALLRRAEGIRVLPDDAIGRLAAAADIVLFGAGEHLIAAGEVPQQRLRDHLGRSARHAIPTSLLRRARSASVRTRCSA